MSEAPVVVISSGAVRGVREGDADVFRGIPYAAAPVGPLRFAEPAPAPAWEGERDATAYGPTPAKLPPVPPFDQILSDPIVPGDDVLNLNVWTPRADPDARLPVLVWIHGGAFRGGTGAVESYKGDAFARDGVVCVTINYRLGMDGFGHLPDAPDNRGLLDQLAALEWVRREIAAFGGDPERVTIAGESAGAMSAVTLLAAERGRGLFRGVIAESGAGQHVQTPESATRVAAELGRRLGVEPTAAAFATVPLGEFLAAQGALSLEVSSSDRAAWGAVGLDGMAFEPVVAGDVVPRRPIEALQQGAGADVSLLIGCNEEEYRFWLVPMGILPHVTAEAIPATAAVYGVPAEAAAAYADEATPGQGVEQVITDWFFRVPALRAAEARADGPAPTYVYEFRWRSPVQGGDFGAAHAVEIGFAFDTLAVESGWGLVGPDAPQALADEMHAAWVAFVRDGNPGWAPYAPDDRQVRIFGGADGAGAVEVDPRGERRQVWDGLR
ncbi:carboxylesterase/lipase family protein [Patulibacter americanus]|uniref:carboxylesterase/lipase family protein n=1 Tax=Patulibacter americanus TaxID=588672 RepID=UPI0003B67595|nr:carboxylesterase family protein [Patulibacter americanus]